MPAMPPRAPRLGLVAAAFAILAGCSAVDGASRRITDAITPYKVEVVQGNHVSKEQVEALQKGMSPEQVRQILGTPLVTSLFHGERWDYVFTLKRQGVDQQRRQLTVFFKDGSMDRVEGDPMPSEADFVSTLDNRRKGGKIPKLEATEEELRRFNANKPAAAAAPQPAASAPVSASYPPLESAPR
ncbi:MAG TPA: outer membrane protein assembly factor BamE [Ramlibacter sp.]|uniref:outer membrane protein assembly factor BamE n=1 Tax=Ramlibacter sp. TaxID=1917967 RepID=UPI002ED6BBD9